MRYSRRSLLLEGGGRPSASTFSASQKANWKRSCGEALRLQGGDESHGPRAHDLAAEEAEVSGSSACAPWTPDGPNGAARVRRVPRIRTFRDLAVGEQPR